MVRRLSEREDNHGLRGSHGYRHFDPCLYPCDPWLSSLPGRGITGPLAHHAFEPVTLTSAVNMYGILADLLVAVHVAYVAYVVVGQLAIWTGWAFGCQFVRN